MKSLSRPLCLLFAAGFFLSAVSARAQYEISVGNFNPIYVAHPDPAPSGPPEVLNPPPTAGQYSAVGIVGGSFGPIDSRGLRTAANAASAGTIPAEYADRYASTPDNTIVLEVGFFGAVFSTGVPRYFLGDEITAPLVQADGVTEAAEGYWRQKPVLPGESFPSIALPVTVVSSSTASPTVELASVPASLVSGSSLLGANVNSVSGTTVTLNANAGETITAAVQRTFVPPTPQVVFPLATVDVTEASTSSELVTVVSVPPELVVGAKLLGQPVTQILGNTVTLAGDADSTINGTSTEPIEPELSFYYSPHAEKVFASQPGRVSITWVSRLPNGDGAFDLKTETFAVSSNTQLPVRTIFWTEGSFDGPQVKITDSRITTVNPVYYSVVPKAVAQEVQIPGYVPPVPNVTTLSFERFSGLGTLKAYNVEGRVLVEYLGDVRLAGNIHDHVGRDVVEIKRVPNVFFSSTHLGKEIKPYNNNPDLQAAPVLSGIIEGEDFYGTIIDPDGRSRYFAEQATSAPNDPDDDSPASPDAYNKVVFYWLETGGFGIQWPTFQNRYWLRWSPNLVEDYVHYTVDPGGSTAAEGISFSGGTLPEIVYQDDGAQTEAAIDLNTQRMFVTLRNGRERNRALLKFLGIDSTWYVNVHTQAEARQQERDVTTDGSHIVSLASGTTTGLEVGMVVTGPGLTGLVQISRILNGSQVELSQVTSTDATLQFTTEGDGTARIDTTAKVGVRISPPAGHEIAGAITGGTAYYPQGYIDPFVSGAEAANQGAIIPVNALPTDNQLTVRWFKKIPALNAEFQDFYVPGKIGRYTISYPASTDPKITIAEGVGTDDLTPDQAAGSIYYQNDPAKPGYNPNEEHALMLGGRGYALRDDLNVTSGAGYTSEPFVLVAYTSAVDDRPAIQTYQVERGTLEYDAVAGNALIKPYPLPLLPLALVGSGPNRTAKDVEIVGADVPNNADVAEDLAYEGFTFKDRKGFTWVHRGPHDGGTPTLTMKLYYVSREGFFNPGSGVGFGELPPGTILPFLRDPSRTGQPLNVTAIEVADPDGPVDVVYTPKWPLNAPKLNVAETLTLPKFNLPQVRGQTSAQVFYQQSIAQADTGTEYGRKSVTLHDPTREKAVELSRFGLTRIPDVILTTSYQGKLYFQKLAPHLQQRLYLDPLRGTNGALVFVGEFHDEIAGEDYLDLNVLTQSDLDALKALVPEEPDKTKWANLLNKLATEVETFVPNLSKLGEFIVDGSKTVEVGPTEIAEISHADTAVDSYAITATGQGSGFVTMVFGNGSAFTPEGDPVEVQIFQVTDDLYVGDLKTVFSSNPLDEQVTLRHSGDYAARPQDYEFEWRWATAESGEPPTYTFTMDTVIGDPIDGTQQWRVVEDPGAVVASEDQIAAASPVPLQRTVNVRPVNYVLDLQGQPTSEVIQETSYTDDDIAEGYPSLYLRSTSGLDLSPANYPLGIPDRIVFSAELGTLDGFVLYINGRPAIAYNAPASGATVVSAASGLTENGLSKQFSLARSYFEAGPNVIDVAIYTSADPNAESGIDFRLEVAVETDAVVTGNRWQDPQDTAGVNTNIAVVGGSPTNPFGGSTFVINDRWFTMRYRAKTGTVAHALTGGEYSRWMPPGFVPGWIKRVLNAINPFDQRVRDLYNNAINTDVSVLTQAGTRWEGNIALNLDNVNDAGLIEIYETVLNRGRSLSIDANTNDPDTNQALLLAAGYLNDLYVLLGNEAFADAANPTISIDDQSSISEVNTSRFAFENQVSSSLDEELALLKGRDDFESPGVRRSPAYNRLYWNYTQGINGGEAIYAVNYNIKEKVGSDTADGVIDESDAQRMFPQAHGDAYGHYLTALKGYYRLLSHPNYTWTPRAETQLVLGQPVTVDYQDERRFAASAGHVARTAEQVLHLVYRQSYNDDPAQGWDHLSDNTPNSSTGVTRRQGFDEWSSRAGQGAYFHWVTANALVPEEDIYNTGLRKIDRSTVPEIPQLAVAVESIQTTMDNANVRLNPLGLSPGAIAFDLSPTEMKAGNSHFEQIYDRALGALNNAAGAFNQAGRMTRSLREQVNQIDDYNAAIVQQERAYVNELIDVYGRPYDGDVGPGKLYAQGYVGPDLVNWFIVDRPNDLVNTSRSFSYTFAQLSQVGFFTGNNLQDIVDGFQHYQVINGQRVLVPTPLVQKTVTWAPSQFVQYNDVWKEGGLGSRPETGELQDALQDAQQTYLALQAGADQILKENARVRHMATLFEGVITTREVIEAEEDSSGLKVAALNAVEKSLTYVAENTEAVVDGIQRIGESVKEAFPRVLGFSNDATSAGRTAALIAANVAAKATEITSIAAKIGAKGAAFGAAREEGRLAQFIDEKLFGQELAQLAYEYDNAYRNLLTNANEMMQLTLEHQRALENVRNVIAKGNRILAEREVFRQRAAAIIQGYRTRDLTFRIFRNEALEQYRSLFDLASRYTYLAAKSYDYETGLLGTTAGNQVFSRIVQSRALGDLTGGVPQSTSSTLGDAGLAGTMAQLNAEFSVAEGRLGINNPDQYGTVFSLRAELFRILDDPASTGDDESWRQTLEQYVMANILTDADVATHCRNVVKPDGSRVPGIVLPFSTVIEHGKNFFGLDLAPGDHAYTATNFATKIYNAGIALPGYIGMDSYASGNPNGAPNSSHPDALSATPYLYVIPCGADFMLAPPLGDTNTLRSWVVQDQALPLPFNLGENDFNSTQFFNANGTLSEQPWILRKHQAFRPVDNATFFYGGLPHEFTNSRLVGRSVWNSQWKIVIPAYTLHNNEEEGLTRFVRSVKDIQLFLRTYSHSGN